MTPEQLDALIRRHTPPVDLAAERMDRLADSVMRRLDRQMPPRRTWWGWTNRPPERRFALLMIASAVAGLLLGHQMEEPQAVVPQLGSLLSSSSFFPIGS